MRIGFRTSPQNTDWPSLEEAWAEAGRHDVFDSGWLNDHLSDPGRDRAASLSCSRNHSPANGRNQGRPS